MNNWISQRVHACGKQVEMIKLSNNWTSSKWRDIWMKRLIVEFYITTKLTVKAKNTQNIYHNEEAKKNSQTGKK